MGMLEARHIAAEELELAFCRAASFNCAPRQILGTGAVHAEHMAEVDPYQIIAHPRQAGDGLAALRQRAIGYCPLHRCMQLARIPALLQETAELRTVNIGEEIAHAARLKLTRLAALLEGHPGQRGDVPVPRAVDNIAAADEGAPRFVDDNDAFDRSVVLRHYYIADKSMIERRHTAFQNGVIIDPLQHLRINRHPIQHVPVFFAVAGITGQLHPLHQLKA
ncbi:hypothetical protein D3C73_1159900 [compost metagenome]